MPYIDAGAAQVGGLWELAEGFTLLRFRLRLHHVFSREAVAHIINHTVGWFAACHLQLLRVRSSS